MNFGRRGDENVAELKYWLWLTTRKGLDAAGVLTVLDHFITPERAWYADREECDALPLSPAARRGLLDKSLDEPDRILAECDRLSLRIMTVQDAEYPQRLRQIADPPAVLYIRGKAFRFDEEAAIAVVGAREPSSYGRWAAEAFGMGLASGGALVVSGIAEGLDSCAIRGALKGGGPVVSLLPGGIDRIVPRSNRFLAEDVAAVGALISEYPPGAEVRAEHYRPRNRILSGLCLGVLAVECRPYGGTMLTVGHAAEQGRDVFAVPGAINAPASLGTNLLIRQGARLVTDPRDILEEYADRFPARLGAAAPLPPQVAQARLSGPDKPGEAAEETQQHGEQPAVPPAGPTREVIPLGRQKSRFTDDELAILAVLEEKTLSADEIVERTQIAARYVLSALTMLQVQGAVEERPGRRFRALVELER